MRPTLCSLASLVIWLLSIAGCTPRAKNAEVQIAVASNFSTTLQKLAPLFERRTGHRCTIASGATGKLEAQIEHGAPFEVLLAADRASVSRLTERGLTVPASRFTYARGLLVLWSSRPDYVDGAGRVLQSGGYRRLAIANPKLAPYGRAALEVLDRLGLHEAAEPKLVQGENIAQTYQFVASGNAELGFVALSQVRATEGSRRGSSWLVPQALYAPILQDAVLLEKGKQRPAALAFLQFLQSAEARALIEAAGYEAPHAR